MCDFNTEIQHVNITYYRLSKQTHHFIGSIYEVMETDSLSSTRAMASPVPADDVLEYFDEISYLKV